MSLSNSGKLLWEINSWRRDLESRTFEGMGERESRKSSSRHYFTRSHYFFICISFRYQSKKKKKAQTNTKQTRAHTTAVMQWFMVYGLCSCYVS